MLQPFFEWMQGLALSAFFLESVWPTPIVQCIHLVAVAVFAGALLLVDLRLLGTGLTMASIPQVARVAQPWLVGSFVVLVLTGIPQMTSTAMKQYYSPFFWGKMQVHRGRSRAIRFYNGGNGPPDCFFATPKLGKALFHPQRCSQKLDSGPKQSDFIGFINKTSS